MNLGRLRFCLYLPGKKKNMPQTPGLLWLLGPLRMSWLAEGFSTMLSLTRAQRPLAPFGALAEWQLLWKMTLLSLHNPTAIFRI